MLKPIIHAEQGVSSSEFIMDESQHNCQWTMIWKNIWNPLINTLLFRETPRLGLMVHKGLNRWRSLSIKWTCRSMTMGPKTLVCCLKAQKPAVNSSRMGFNSLYLQSSISNHGHVKLSYLGWLKTSLLLPILKSPIDNWHTWPIGDSLSQKYQTINQLMATSQKIHSQIFGKVNPV